MKCRVINMSNAPWTPTGFNVFNEQGLQQLSSENFLQVLRVNYFETMGSFIANLLIGHSQSHASYQQRRAAFGKLPTAAKKNWIIPIRKNWKKICYTFLKNGAPTVLMPACICGEAKTMHPWWVGRKRKSKFSTRGFPHIKTKRAGGRKPQNVGRKTKIK